ncbi:MAG: hypothetical protein RBR41_10360 [Desulfovibrio sp.]|uniref:hypothetical protein n=1 Tax=Desulfovibrio sp. TaxID=885 RepID=UPI002A35C522|nr:hypothetical protein [Desulfovibrio sp.]MDY0260051.1 hypothetical protein [Desulfovibrio sp.]
MGRALKNSPNIEYYIELKPAVVEAYFAFRTPRKEGKREISADDFNSVAFEGTIILSGTRKIALETIVILTLHDAGSDKRTGGLLQKRKNGTFELFLYIKQELFFRIFDYIRDGTIKYVRAFGNELYRGSAAIYDTDFSFSLDQG